MQAVMFRFALDTHLALPANVIFKTVTNDTHALVRCNPHCGDRMFSYEQGNYGWLSEPDTIIGVVTTSNSRGTESVARKVYMYKNGGETFSAGYVDPRVYTILEIVINVKSGKDLDTAFHLATLQKQVEAIKNHFIDIYRLVSQQPHIERPDVYDSAIITVLVSKDDVDLSSEAFDVEFVPFRTTLSWNDPFQKGYGLRTLTSSKLHLLTSMLSQPRPVRLYEQLLLESKTQAHVHKNYALSLVLAETGFETFVQETTMRLCEGQGVAFLKVGRGAHSTDKPYNEAIRSGNIGDLLDYLRDLTRWNPKDTKAYSKWYNDAYNPRNAVVHNGNMDIASKSCEKAFNAVTNFIREVEQHTSQ